MRKFENKIIDGLIITILLLAFSQISFSQNKKIIHIDENFKVIGSEEFEKKIKSNFFVNATTENDSSIFKKVRFREYFGKLTIKKKSQLNKLLFSKHNIDTTKIWLIHHTDTLPNIKKFHNKSGVVLLDSLGNEYGGVITVKEFNSKYINRLYYKNKANFGNTHKVVISFSDYKKIAKNEKREFEKFKNLEFFHFYNFNKNYPLKEDDFNWTKDENLIFQKIFSDGNVMYMNLIIYPNGDFYAHSGRASLNKQKKLLKIKKYYALKRKWEQEYKKITKLSTH